MKKLKTLMIILLVAASGDLFAQQFIAKQLQRDLVFPYELKTGEFKDSVTIRFAVLDGGVMDLKQVICENDTLKQIIEKQLPNIRLEDAYPSCGTVFKLTIHFSER